VVDPDGTLVGILGRLDILNTIAAVHLPEWRPEVPAAGPSATVSDVMSREVPTLHESATIEQVFNLLVASSHKRVVVVDDGRHVAGIIADSDLISKLSREGSPGLLEILVSKIPIGKISDDARKDVQKLRARSARELMTREVITVRDKMPVVNADGELAGIVGRTEMLRALLA
jgi:CBS-domain-containing membrane protein